jgi:Gp49-like protein DUF891
MLRRMFERRLRGYRAIGYARGEAPLGFGGVNDEVVVEYDEPYFDRLAPMSELTWHGEGGPEGQAAGLAWRRVKSPPFSKAVRIETGYLLREVQRGRVLPMPHSRPMPAIGPRCHELRVVDAAVTWRIVYRTDPDAIVIVEVFAKKTLRPRPQC